MEYGSGNGFLDYSKASRSEMMGKGLTPLIEYEMLNG